MTLKLLKHRDISICDQFNKVFKMLVTIRLIKSFEFRTIFHLIIKDFDTLFESGSATVDDLKGYIEKGTCTFC